jgi:diguanylate cyclase (GGDEF)-like protein
MANDEELPPERPSIDPTRTVRIQRGLVERVAEMRALKAYLTVIRGSDHDLGRHLLVETAVVLGREDGVGFTLHDHGVSRRHAKIERQGDGSCVLTDLRSTNGTLVNGTAVSGPCRLASSDKIFLGETVLRFGLADEIELGYQLEVAQIVGEDPLTGLESKRRFDDAMVFALENAKRGARPLAMLMMDMDGVKQINDTHGHLFGAHVIGETGRLIARHVSDGGHACRFGGDEFSAFLPGCDKAEAARAAEAIRAAVETAGMEKDGIPLAPTISIGVAVYPTDAETPVELLAKADAALYRAKGAGKNRVAT